MRPRPRGRAGEVIELARRDTETRALRDGHGRLIGDLRLGGGPLQLPLPVLHARRRPPWLDRSEILTFEETERLVALFASMGVGD